MSYHVSNAAASAGNDAIAALLNTGYIKIYSGTRPATVDTALSGNTLLAQPRFGATAFGASSNGVATANSITADSSAAATGTATFARLFKSDGTTAVGDMDISTTGNQTITASSNANPVSITCTSHGLTTGKNVTISGYTSGWASANGLWTVTVTGSNTFTIPVDSTSFGAQSGSPVFAASEIVLNSVAIQSGAQVSISSMTLTQSK